MYLYQIYATIIVNLSFITLPPPPLIINTSNYAPIILNENKEHSNGYEPIFLHTESH